MRYVILCLVAIPLLILAPYLIIKKDSVEPNPVSTSASTKYQQAQVAHIDSLTGRLTSQPDSIPVTSSQQQTARNLLPLEKVQLPDGSVMVKLNGKFNIPVMAKISEDGKLTVQHGDEKTNQ